MRVLLAVLAGFTNQALHVGQAALGDPMLAFLAAIGLGIAFYLISVGIVKYVLHYGEAELKGKHRYITLGGGTFIVVWIMVIVLLNTLIR
jgi:hypothetical protein